MAYLGSISWPISARAILGSATAARCTIRNMYELDEYLVNCPKCNTRTLAEPVTHTVEDTVPWDDCYVVVACKICYEYMLISHPKDETAAKYNFKRINKMLWPVSVREFSSTIPESLRLEHKEARACFNNAAYTATVVMVRRTLEGVCSENGVKKAPLISALKEMQNQGLIEGRLLEWAQELRVLGNEGAHFTGRRVSREDAQDALALAEALLDYLYVFSAQFAEFKRRRQNRTKENASDDASEKETEDGNQ